MSDIIIKAENLGKKYTIGHQAERDRYTALRDVLMQNARNIWNKTKDLATGKPIIQGDTLEEVWALKNVNFEIHRGEAAGIIGRNGAGKSTLLKILSRITEPSAGRVTIKGRVTSLLEVGTGFHPELSGRENIYLNGTILGMTRAEIRQKFDEIVAFAEVEKYLDTPVKRYSSGMYVRLAFAVAAHLEPEILVVDEVLAVGDAAFQKKCLGKMGDVAKEGRTVLFVSHNMEAVRKLCTSGILLQQGRVSASGIVGSVIKRYITDGFQNLSEFVIPAPKKDVPGFAHRLVIEDKTGKPANLIPIGQPWQIRIFITINQTIDHFTIAVGFVTDLNMPLRTTWSRPIKIEPGEYQAVFQENTVLLTTGLYPLIVGLSAHERTFQYEENAGYLRIAEISKELELVKVQGCGLILNQLQVKILKTEIRD